MTGSGRTGAARLLCGVHLGAAILSATIPGLPGPARAEVAAAAIPSMEAVGEVREMAQPDQAKIVLRIEASAVAAAQASAELTAKVNRVLGVVTAAGIAEADTESDGPTVQATYESVRNERGQEIVEKRRRTGYAAGYGLTLTTGNLDAVAGLLPRLAEAGALVRQVDFRLSDRRGRLLALEERAVKEAVARAGRLIAAAGARPGRILSIGIPGEEVNPPPYAVRTRAALRSAEPAEEQEIALPVRPGRIPIEARVSVRVEILVP